MARGQMRQKKSRTTKTARRGKKAAKHSTSSIKRVTTNDLTKPLEINVSRPLKRTAKNLVRSMGRAIGTTNVKRPKARATRSTSSKKSITSRRAPRLRRAR